jgi:hypothetical protein
MTGTVRPAMTGAANVVAGWLGLRVPPIPKQRRRPYRKVSRARELAAERRPAA